MIFYLLNYIMYFYSIFKYDCFGITLTPKEYALFKNLIYMYDQKQEDT